MKKMNNKGFTLAELLIVVAIIGVLAVIAIPIFSTQLEKSRENTDIANLRAAKGLAVSMYLDKGSAAAGTYFFDEGGGVLVDAVSKVTGTNGYGRGTAKKGGCEDFWMSTTTQYKETDNVEGKVIQIVIAVGDAGTSDASDITMSWVAKSTPTT